MGADGTALVDCCGFSFLQGCCWGRKRRVQPESNRPDAFPHPHRLHMEGTGLGLSSPYSQ
ncbi:unnamed protein product, partial [Merluccius merluccius]